MGGHLCGNAAVDGSEFCAVHDPERQAAREAKAQAAADELPVGEATYGKPSSRTTVRLSADWKPGEGPVIDRPYYKGYRSRLTQVRASLSDDGKPVTFSVTAQRLKADGSVGVGVWSHDLYYNGSERSMIPPLVREELELRLRQKLELLTWRNESDG